MKNINNYESIHRVSPLYFIIVEVDGYNVEKMDMQYLLPQIKTKEYLKKDIELCDGIKGLIERMNGKLGEYGKVFMKIKSSSDDNLLLNKKLPITVKLN